MKITNIRVYNNYKVKLINARLSSVDSARSIVSEQGTRSPDIPTPGPTVRTFEEKFNIVFEYLMKRYEPGWSAADVATGKAATMALLGVSAPVNPLILGGTVEAGFNLLTSSDIGWFDPLTHPKDFAKAVKAAYHVFERTRKPKKAKHRFIDYHLNGMGEYSYTRSGGNMFFSMRKDFRWYPDAPSYGVEYHGWSLAHENCVERHLLHSPYGIFRSPMFASDPDPTKDATSWYHKQSLPWMTDRYAPNAGWVFDHYLKMRESTTLRDLLTDCSVERDASLGVIVDGVTDTYLNTFYRGMCYPAGYYSKSYWTRDQGGYSADQVLVGSPWIPYPNGLTWIGQLSGTFSAGLCFDRQTLVMFDGSTFPMNPQVITDRPVDFTPGLSWGNGEFRIQDLNSLSNAWGNSLEFIFYTGLVPYGIPQYEQVMPWMMYKDPTVPENVRYFKWRMDASMSHWKEKFKSPIDGFAHTCTDSASGIERTFHQYQPPDYMTWANIHPSGLSFVESIPVSWFRDQFNYTRGPSGPNPEKGLITGVELFAWYDWNGYPNLTFMKKSSTDTNPKLWCLDDDIAADLYCSIYDMVVGQRFNGYTLTDQLFGASAGGTLGEMLTSLRIYTDQRTIDAYPFYYNTFIELKGNTLEWKGIPGTSSTIYGDPNGKIPWFHDRRFTLFYHYPIALALGGTIMDHMFDGMAYYSVGGSRFYDKNLGNIWEWDMEPRSLGPVVSNFPLPNRRTPTTPPKNFWTGNARTSEFELLYCCMKAGITGGLDSLFFTQLYNELEPSGATETPREGYFRALDYAVYGAAYFGLTGDTPSIVPLVKPYDNSLIFYRGVINPGSTAGMPNNQYADYKATSMLIPPERRVFIPIYWLVDGPPSQRQGEYFFKRTADGTTYTGSIPGITYLSTEYGGTFTNLDTSPLKFNTPWAYVNRQVAKDSFKNFLQQSKNDGIVFSVINDDNESLNTFSLGGFYNSPGSSINDLIVTTTESVDPNWTSEELSLVVPSLYAGKIGYRHFVYATNLDWQQWTGTTPGDYNLAVYEQKLTNNINSLWSANSLAGSTFKYYFGQTPEYLILNPLQSTVNPVEIQTLMGVTVDITTAGTTGQLIFSGMNGLLNTTKTAFPSSNVTQFQFPNIPYYIFPQIVGGNAVDSADWNSCAWCGSSGDLLAAYAAEKTYLLNSFKSKVDLHEVNVDSISIGIYPPQTQVFANQYNTNAAMQAWVSNSCVAAKQATNKSIVVDTQWSIDTNNNNEWNETALRGLTLSDLLSQIDGLGTGPTKRLVHTTQYMNDQIFNPIKAAGVKRINFWGAWKYWWTVAANPVIDSANSAVRSANFDILFTRKRINDLFLDRGISGITFDDNAAWASTQTKTRLLQSVVDKEIELANAFRLKLPPAGNQTSLDSFVSTYGWLEAPDTRRLVALTKDSRFNGITNSVTNRTLAEEFMYNYNSMLQADGYLACGLSAETLLSTYFTNVSDRSDFKQPWGDEERLRQYYAWDSAIYTFCHGDLKSKIIGGSLNETSGFGAVKKYSSDLYAMNASEARFATDLNGHRRIQAYIPGYGHEVHCYGQLSGGKNASGIDPTNGGGVINLFGYPPGATTDEATRYGKSFGWHPVSDGGITFGCSAYQAMIADVRRLRGILRTRPQAYQDGIRVWINGGVSGQVDGWSGDTSFTQFYAGNCFAAEYYKEHFYHLCLNGVEAFNIFNTFGPVSLPNQLLIDWKTISGNTLAKPCTNATATVGATVDRIDLYEAGTNMVISGGDIGVTGSRLWRMTAPPGKIRFTKTSTTQTTLPDIIPIPANSRGVWLEAPASYGIPKYQSE